MKNIKLTVKRKPKVTNSAPMFWPEIPSGPHQQAMAMQVVFQQNEWMTTEQIQKKQMTQIEALVDHAHRTVPFYKKHYANISKSRTTPFSIDDLRNLPILRRDHIQNEGAKFVTSALPPSHGRMFDVSTSGSTGRPLTIKGTSLTGLYFIALGLRYHLWHHRDLSGKIIVFKALDIETKEQWSSQWTPIAKSSPALMVNHVQPSHILFDIVLKHDPAYLQLFPSTLRDLLRLSIETGKKPASLKEVLCVSETLDSDLRLLCQDTWGVPISQNYSNMEMGLMALQCPETENLHVQSENCLIEVLDNNDNPCPPGKIGRVVVTCLNNYASPLIRYENGDMAVAGELCSCGRGLPVLKSIAGRVWNLVMLPSGERSVPSLGFYDGTLRDLPVRQYKYTQKNLQLIEVDLVVNRPLSEDEENRIGNLFNKRIGNDFTFKYNYVDEIKTLPSGKYEEFSCDIGR